jgi:hypothetical protein
MRFSIRPNTPRNSRRTMSAPMQRCGPRPKAMWRLLARSKSTSSGFANSVSSRFPDTQGRSARSPGFNVCPANSTSRITVRLRAWAGEKTRRNSSSACGIKRGVSASRRRCSGLRDSQTKPDPMPACVASSVPMITQMVASISQLSSLRPSTVAPMRWAIAPFAISWLRCRTTSAATRSRSSRSDGFFVLGWTLLDPPFADWMNQA